MIQKTRTKEPGSIKRGMNSNTRNRSGDRDRGKTKADNTRHDRTKEHMAKKTNTPNHDKRLGYLRNFGSLSRNQI